MSATQSLTNGNDTEQYGADNAIDGSYETRCWAVPGSSKAWLKISLEAVHCIERVISYQSQDKIRTIWICSGSGCNDCINGAENYCNGYNLTISTENEVAPEVGKCRYQAGNMVKLQVEWMLRDGGSLIAYELAIVAAIGKIILFKAMIHNDSQLDLQDKISGHRVKIRLKLSFLKDRFDRQTVSILC